MSEDKRGRERVKRRYGRESEWREKVKRMKENEDRRRKQKLGRESREEELKDLTDED